MTTTNEPKKKSKLHHLDIIGPIFFVSLVFIGLIVLIAITINAKRKVPSNTAEICLDTTIAIAKAEELITKRLNNPKTAAFVRDTSAGLIYKGNCHYLIWGIVTSKNGFDKTITSKYRIRLRYKPASNYWGPMDMSILPQ